MDVSVEFVKLILFETGRYEVNLTFDDISKSTTLYVEGNVQLANLPKFQFSVTDQGHNGASFHRKMRVRLSLLDRNSSQPVLYGEGETFFCLPDSPSNPFYSPTVVVRSAIGRINKVVSTPCNVVQMILTVPSQNIMALKKYRGRAWLRLNTPLDMPSAQHHPVGMNPDDISVENNPQLQWAGLPPRDIQTPSSDESYTPTHSPQLADVNRPSPSNRSPSPPSNQLPSNHSPSPQSIRSPSPQSNRSPSPPRDHSRPPSSHLPAPPHSQHQAVELNLTDTPTVNQQDTPSTNSLTSMGPTSPHPQTQLKCETCSSRAQNAVSCAVQTDQDWVKSYSDRQTVEGANSGEQCGFGDGVATSTDTDLPSLRTMVTSLLGDHNRFEREGVSTPVRGVSLSTDHNSDVLRVLAMELKGYREANARLGQEIHSLKREEGELREQVEFYKSMAVPKVADQFLGKNDSEIANQLRSLPKGDLYLKSLELHGQCRALSQQVVAYREKVVVLQNSLIARNDHEEDLLQLQKAHTEQQQILLDLRDKTERLKKFKETCQLQESVITKLEDLVTSRTRGYGPDTSCAVQRTLAEENKRLRELVSRLESQTPRSGPHTAHTNAHSPQRKEYLDQIKRISLQCDSLEQRLKQVTVERDSSQASSHLLQLEQNLILVSSELEAVKEELQANVSTWAKEKTQYEITISQQEARLEQLEVHRN